MIKEFLIGVMLMFIALLFIFMHAFSYNTEATEESYRAIIAITKTLEPSFALSRYEVMAREGSTLKSNSIYPELPPIDYMGYIYVQ